MSTQPETQPAGQSDVVSDTLAAVFKFAFVAAVVLVALPLVLPLILGRSAEAFATKHQFWVVRRGQWIANTLGALMVGALLTVEIVWLVQWGQSGDAKAFFDSDNWGAQLLPTFGPWLLANFLSGVLLLPLTWSFRRRRIAEEVRARRISNVERQERIETARKRAADATAARNMGVQLDRATGVISGVSEKAMMVPYPVDGRQALGMISRVTVKSIAEHFYDVRRVPDWVNPTGRYVVMPQKAAATRALLIAESGTGKTKFITGLVLSALEQGWPVFFLDAKGDPADADELVAVAESYGRTAVAAGPWNLFNGTAEQITAKLMRLMPPPDGANQHYLDEIRGVLQAVQDKSPIASVGDLRHRLTNPGQFVRDAYDLSLVTKPVDRTGTETAGTRSLQALMVALRPLERWINEDGWSYSQPKADVTVVPLSPVDDAQARLGDLLMLDLRNFLASRLQDRIKTNVLVIVDEFPQLVTGSQDPGDTAGSLFETARSANVGLILATQSPSGLSNDETRRRRALTSGAALIFGRTKDPEDVVKYAGTFMRMEASGRATGEELGSARAQHTYVIPPQDVREANMAAFWVVQGGAIAPFRAFPTRTVAVAASRPATASVDAEPASVEIITDAVAAPVEEQAHEAEPVDPDAGKMRF